jgi:hypothetical protein
MNTNKRMLIGVAIALLAAAANVGADAFIDPTRPYDRSASNNQETTSRGPVLQSTIVSGANRSATISGKRVRVGDAYEGAVITDITSYEVRMTKGGHETSLRLLPKLAKEKGASQ